MKYTYPNTSWFTLIEIIVALTIFSMMMISVMTIFYLAAQMSTRIEMNRHMQENIKNALDIIAEDVRQNSILWWSWVDGSCKDAFTQWEDSDKLCLQTSLWVFEYTIWKKVESDGKYFFNNDCLDILEENCYILKRDPGTSDYYPLTNNKSHITRLEFQFFNTQQPKVQITVWIRPALRQGMVARLIERQEMIVQTTLSERYIPLTTH